MTITLETPDDIPDIEVLLDLAFGSERSGKTVYRLRQGVRPIPELCTVIREEGVLKGTLRFWPVVIGAQRVPALLLGPVAVAPADRGKGYARELIWAGLERARELGYRIVLLVGDEPYYLKFGFTRAFTTALSLPGPVDLDRFLGLELQPRALAGVSGMVNRAEPDEAQPRVRDSAA
ncbi:MAG TPA: N-acetyltransferase [Alphaproteobacteria bacterium]|nr:N-acetyltransferase [Alphaproteobacteria bacterium]